MGAGDKSSLLISINVLCCCLTFISSQRKTLAGTKSMSKEQLGADLLSSFTFLRVQEINDHIHTHILFSFAVFQALLQGPVLATNEVCSYQWVNIMYLTGFGVLLVSFAPGLQHWSCFHCTSRGARGANTSHRTLTCSWLLYLSHSSLSVLF